MELTTLTFSPTGGTQKVADCLSEGLPLTRRSADLLCPAAAVPTFGEADICILAVPSFGGRVPVAAAQRIRALHGGGARAILVCVYGNRAYDDTLLELQTFALSAGFRPVAAVAAVAAHSIAKSLAAGRPDAADLAELHSFSQKIWAALQLEYTAPPQLPGNTPYREFGGVPLHPRANRHCNGCGLCARECPVGAIDAGDLKKTNSATCITCMHCVAVCKQHARSLPALPQHLIDRSMCRQFGARKQNELFLPAQNSSGEQGIR